MVADRNCFAADIAVAVATAELVDFAERRCMGAIVVVMAMAAVLDVDTVLEFVFAVVAADMSMQVNSFNN